MYAQGKFNELIKTGTLYDVCNDYSLSRAETQKPPDARQYRHTDGFGGTLFIHKEYEELHYFVGPDGMDGTVLPYED